MAYPLSSPVDINDTAPVELTFTNTAGSKIWKVATDIADNLLFGTASVDVVTIEPESISEPNGAFHTTKIKHDRNVNSVNVYADSALVTSYDMVYPPTVPFSGQVMMISGPSSSQFIDINPLKIVNGGTNSSTSLNNDRIIVSSGGAIVEASALTNGQLLIGSTGAAPVASTITAGTGIDIVNGAGSITISGTSANSIILSASTTQVSVGDGVVSIVGYIPWSDVDYGAFTTRTVTAWVIPSTSVGKDLTISVLPDGGPSIGSLVILGGSTVGALYTFTITNPGVDTNLQFQVSRSGVSGQNAVINGMTLKLA